MKIRYAISTILVSSLLLISCETADRAIVRDKAVGREVMKVVYSTRPNTLNGYLCRPSGTGKFPAVLYNHGGVGNIIGGAPKETCEALAAVGFVGFVPRNHAAYVSRADRGRQYAEDDCVSPLW